MPTKDRNKAHKEAVRRMEKQLKALRGSAKQLEEEHQALSATHATLQHMGDLLDWMLQQQHEHHSVEQLELFQETAAAAQELLQQQHSIPSRSSSGVSGSSSELVTPAGDLIAPPDDPLQALRLAMSQPLYSPLSLTVDAFLQEYAADVREIAVHLHKVDAAPLQLDSTAPGPLDRLKAVVQRRVWIVSSLVMQRRQHLLALSTVKDFETGAMLATPDEQHHMWAIQQIGLSQQQLQRMVLAFRVYRRLLTPVLDEMRQLQQEMGSSSSRIVDAISSSHVSSHGEMAAAAMTCGSTKNEQAIRQHMAAAELERQKAKRLHALLHKDYLIKMCSGAHLYCGMTWTQLGRLLVLMTPYNPSAAVLSVVIERLWDQQRQSQQQQQSNCP